MDETSFRADKSGHACQKSDNVMLCFTFNPVNLFNIEICFLTNDGRRLFGDNTKLCLSVAGMNFNFKPDTEAAFIGPDLLHLLTGIAWDHHSFHLILIKELLHSISCRIFLLNVLNKNQIRPIVLKLEQLFGLMIR